MSTTKEKNMPAPLKLQETDFVGKGCHKLTYIHPEDKNKCIKVIYNKDGITDIERELRYRKYRDDHHLTSTVLPGYYGTVETDKGLGYIFEYVCDYDGKISLTLMDYVHNEDMLEKDYATVVALLKELKEHLWSDKIVSMGITPENIVFQRTAPDTFKVYLITDLGVAEIIPFVLYIDSLAYKKIQRHWDKFVNRLPQEWGTGKQLKQLADEIR